MLRYVWIAYSRKFPYLPVAVADTSKELAAALGISRATVTASWRNYRRGAFRRSRYHKVKLTLEETC